MEKIEENENPGTKNFLGRTAGTENIIQLVCNPSYSICVLNVRYYYQYFDRTNTVERIDVTWLKIAIGVILDFIASRFTAQSHCSQFTGFLDPWTYQQLSLCCYA